MRSWKAIAAGATLLAGLAAGSAEAVEGVVLFVDMEQVFDKYHRSRQYAEQLQAQQDEINEQRKTFLEQYKIERQALLTVVAEAQDTSLPEKDRLDKAREVERQLAKVRVLEQRVRTFDESQKRLLGKSGSRMQKGVIDEIVKAVQEQARQRPETVLAVVDSSGERNNGAPLFPFVNEDADITTSVIDYLNQELPEESLTEPVITP